MTADMFFFVYTPSIYTNSQCFNVQLYDLTSILGLIWTSFLEHLEGNRRKKDLFTRRTPENWRERFRACLPESFWRLLGVCLTNTYLFGPSHRRTEHVIVRLTYVLDSPPRHCNKVLLWSYCNYSHHSRSLELLQPFVVMEFSLKGLQNSVRRMRLCSSEVPEGIWSNEDALSFFSNDL